MKILKIKNLSGPNIWANFPVLEVWVDLEAFEEKPSDVLPGFNDRLMAWLPTMIEHRCSEGERGGFFERLRRGTWLGHILEHVTLELQSLAGHVVGFGRARETSTSGVYRVAIEYREAEVAKAAVDAAFRLLMAAVDDKPFNVSAEVNALRNLAEDVCLGPSTQSIVDAAVRRGIPWRRLTKGNLIRFGHGCHQRKIQAAETDTTGAIAESIAQDKELTRRLLGEAGLPVPEGYAVTSLEDAIDTARYIGGAVVVKPQDGNQGRGVATNLTTVEQITAAYEAAKEEGESILVEQYIPGDDYRLLVVGSKLIAAARREPAHVIGDGARSVEQLVAVVNADPRRGSGHAAALTRLKFDTVCLSVLKEQGLTRESIPADGQKVLLRRNANLSTGGTAIDVTADVHPDFAARAVEAAQVVGLEIAGIDIVAADHTKPLDIKNGAIIEVNAAPGLRMHLTPSAGHPQPVGDAIMDLLYPPGQTGRIPIAAITGVNGKTTVTRLVAHIVRQDGRMVGMTCTDGIWLGDRRVDNGDCSGPQSAQAVLAHPNVQTAVLETARGGILRAGLGFDHCDVAVVTNIGEGDHLGLDGVDTLEKLALVKRTIVDVVLPSGTAVLNASDPLVVQMAPKCPGKVLMFALGEHHSELVAHRDAGGAVIFVRGSDIILYREGQELVIDNLGCIPITVNGAVKFQVENVLAAAAACWSMGISLPRIQQGLHTFLPDLKHSPGRFNVLEIRGATVVVDYGHNPSALDALIQAVEPLPGKRRSVVYSTAGDRRNCDIERQGELLGHFFDEVFVYEGHYKRGRADGETIALFEAGLKRGGRVTRIVPVEGALNACRAALENLQPGDLLLMQADQVDETLEFLEQYLTPLVQTVETVREDADVAKTRCQQADSGVLIAAAPACSAVHDRMSVQLPSWEVV